VKLRTSLSVILCRCECGRRWFRIWRIVSGRREDGERTERDRESAERRRREDRLRGCVCGV
jgi:hypothetical protein